MSNKITRALLSVSDKTGLVDFARFLQEQGVELLSTGGSAKALREAGLTVVEVSDHTGFPEIMDGRVKTLQPKIHGGILAVRSKDQHCAQMAEHDIPPIDLVVVNLYPFVQTVASGADTETCIENIDIGGPALIRAAAKNHGDVTVIVDPSDYGRVQQAMAAQEGGTDLPLRRALAATAYAHTAAYDAAIAAWAVTALETGAEPETLPPRLALAGSLKQNLRYGENPHQQAALYLTGTPRPGVATAEQLQGKELSFNNLNDTDAAFELAAEFDRPAIAIIKHANPCGVATADSVTEAYEKALSCDPVSAFGGIIAANRPLDGETAEKIAKLFAEVIIAPDLTPEARQILAAKKNLRVLITKTLPDPQSPGLTYRTVAGGLLVQSRDHGHVHPEALKVVTQRQPSAQEMADMLFAFAVAKHVKSNAIVYAKAGATVGIGAGQMSRVDSSRIAAWKAQEMSEKAGLTESRALGSVVASDAFFPFADGLMAAAEAGATAAIQPGGSVRDEEVIKAADEKGLAMVFTGMRHFRH